MSPETRKKLLYKTPDDPTPFEIQTLDPFDLDYINVSKQLSPERLYWYYIEKGIPSDAVSGIDAKMIKDVEKSVPSDMLQSKNLQKTRKQLIAEISGMHETAIRRSILDYILMDEQERVRLGMHFFPFN